MLTILQVAYGCMWLDGRIDKVTESDYELARIVMAISDRTRTHTQRALEATTIRADKARGESDARRELAKACAPQSENRRLWAV